MKQLSYLSALGLEHSPSQSHTHPSTYFQPSTPNVRTDTDTQTIVMSTLTLVVPLAIVFSVIACRKYRTIRLSQRIAVLEKLWHLNQVNEMS